MSGSLTLGSAAPAPMPERMATIQARFGLGGGRRAGAGASTGTAAASSFDSVLARSGGDATGLGTGTDLTGGNALTGGAPAGGWPLLAGGTLPAGLLAAAGVSPGATGDSSGTGGADTTAGGAVVTAAEEYLGVPYLWGGTDPGKGLDCSGLVQLAYRQVGVEMPKWSRNQATMGVPVDSIDEALPGDVLTFGHPVTHVALYVGDGKMLHAPKRGEVVKIEPIDREIGSIRRIVTPDGRALGTTTPGDDTGDGSFPAGVTPIISVAPAPGRTPAPGAGAAPPASPTTTSTSTAVAAPSTWAAGPAEQRFQQLFTDAGRRWNVDPALLAAVAQTESGFNPEARSPAGAQGLMQFMPATAAELGVNPWDPASAIDGAAHYLRTSLDRFGSAEEAIASYNAGRGAVARFSGVPPYRETRNYVRKVLDAWKDRS